MCGIAGFVGQGDEKTLHDMINAIAHRGPDESGFFCQEGVGLGHCRLSIIDLAGGSQPFFNNDKSIGVVFNGEIYNYRELRRDLEKQGCVFKSNSDTEVIIHSYAAFGEDCVKYFNGMFAFALWDAKQRQLMLARDRLGKKPLYYTWQKNNLVFASEPKALKIYHWVDFKIDRGQLKKYFFYDYIPCPYTPWQQIFKLEPAQYLFYKNNELTVKKYWQLNFERANEILSEKAALQELDQRLAQSVNFRLIADVPLGVFLSGGIDSSTIAWYAARAAGFNQIKTFSIDFKEKTFGEGVFARQVARHLGTDHQELELSGEDSLNIISKLGKHTDEPLADSSLLPTYLLSEFTKKNVTVALGGDGADELFAGYQTFQAERLFQFYQKLPLAIKKILLKASGQLPVSYKYFSLDFKARKFLQAKGDSLTRHQNWLSTFSLDELAALTGDSDVAKILLADLCSFESQIPADNWSKIIAFYLRFYMQERVLVKVDRASMLAALEVRAPFLDYELVEFINSLPLKYKLRGLTTKYLLKKLMKGRLPDNIINRSKKGFSLPLAQWFAGPLKDMFYDLASKSNVEALQILRYDYIASLLNNHVSRKENNGQKLWSVLMFLLWQENFLK